MPVAADNFFKAGKFPRQNHIICLLWQLLKADQDANPSGPRSPLCVAAVDSLLVLAKRIASNAREKSLILSDNSTWLEMGRALSVLGDIYTSRNERVPPHLVIFTLDWWYNSFGKPVEDIDMWILSVAAFDQDTLRCNNSAYDSDVTDGLVDVYGAEKIVARMNAQLQAAQANDPRGETLIRLGNSYSVILRNVEMQKCGIGGGLFAALYHTCLQHMNGELTSSDPELRMMIWNAVASVVRGSFIAHLVDTDGRFRAVTAPMRVYTALSLMLYGGAEFLAYGFTHICPLPTSTMADDDVPGCCQQITHQTRMFVNATKRDMLEHLTGTDVENEHQKMLTALALFRGEFRRVWWPTLRVLREVANKERPDSSHIESLKEWQSLGIELGLSETKESADFEKSRTEARKATADFCGWVTCQYNTEKSSSKLRICAGCEEVAYCSRECQKAHWKNGHKHKCQHRLKDH